MELVIATDEDKQLRDRLAHVAWGSKLTVDQWVVRETRLRAHPWAQQAMTTWLLNDGGETLASCEIFVQDGYVDGVRADVWAVASVFTEERLRKRGHATRLVDLLLERARAAGAVASTLFSDVGASLYERSGYVAMPAEDLIFPPESGDPASGVDALLDAIAVLPPPPDEDFVIWPTAAQIDWHLERSRVYGELLARDAGTWVGARAGDAVLYWSADSTNERLLVQLMAATRAHEAEALLRAARRTARQLKLREVRMWAQPWGFPGRADLGGDRVARRGSLPMIAPLVPSLRAQQWRQIPRAVWV
jgi:GNAT superfamily N-acetyltransferase